MQVTEIEMTIFPFTQYSTLSGTVIRSFQFKNLYQLN